MASPLFANTATTMVGANFFNSVNLKELGPVMALKELPCSSLREMVKGAPLLDPFQNRS